MNGNDSCFGLFFWYTGFPVEEEAEALDADDPKEE
jgi:hypothetical protein